MNPTRRSPSQALHFAGLTLLSVIVAAAGAVVAWRHGSFALLGGGLAGLLAVLAAWGLADQLDAIATTPLLPLLPSLPTTRPAAPPEAAIYGIAERLDRCIALLGTIGEQQLLSERIKSFAFRDRDRQALRAAVQEEMARGNWDSAKRLIEEIADTFGDQADVTTLREEVVRMQDESTIRTVNERLARIDDHIRNERWGDAHQDADSLLREYPSVEQLAAIHHTINGKREVLKKQIRDAWNEAAYRRDIDAAIAHLRRLDSYLTPDEAEAMEETVRGIFREKIDLLRGEFATAVHESRWPDAVRVGEQIVREFPRARIAQEVRETMAKLKDRAETGERPKTPS